MAFTASVLLAAPVSAFVRVSERFFIVSAELAPIAKVEFEPATTLVAAVSVMVVDVPSGVTSEKLMLSPGAG